jgi:hypothetical protein
MAARVLFLALFFCVSAAAAASKTTSGECLGCHSEQSLKSSDGRSMHVDLGVYAGSAHGQAECISCHTDMGKIPHEGKPSVVNCFSCHESEAKSFAESVHRRQGREGVAGRPSCTSCHGGHEILKIKGRPAGAGSLHFTRKCIVCHEDESSARSEKGAERVKAVKAYEKSVHGNALLKKGLSVAPGCPDCHGSHEIKPLDGLHSPVNRLLVPFLCGKCHEPVVEKFKKSVHARLTLLGDMPVTVCTDCHGEHAIYGSADPDSSVYFSNVPRTCGRCHEGADMRPGVKVPTNRVTTYENSFHGMANLYGDRDVARCDSCHGAHDILPSWEPDSPTNPKNLAKTCGKCHPGAGENGVIGAIHVEANLKSSPGIYYVRRFYTWFIGILVGGFVLYMALDLLGRMRRRKNEE